MTKAPTALPLVPEGIPDTLTALDRWVTWRYRKDGEQWRKMPQNCRTGVPARVSDPTSWSTFDKAVTRLRRRKRDCPDGIGFVFASRDGLVGVDLDHCRDPLTGMMEPWALAIVRELDTYTEVSPSGTGVKLILRGALPTNGRRAGNVEMYADKRFFALTGHRVLDCPNEVQNRAEAVLALHAKTFTRTDDRTDETALQTVYFPGALQSDDEVVGHLLEGLEGKKFARLLAGEMVPHRSDSEADLALCGMFARAVGPDSGRVERLFARSLLANRDKWVSRPDYRASTVGRAVQGLAQYSGKRSALAVGLGSGARTYQDRSDNPLTHRGHGHGQEVDELPEEVLAEAVTSAIAFADEQGSQGGDGNGFRCSFDLARRLLKFGPHPEPLAPAVQAYCERSGRPFGEFWLRVMDCWSLVETPEGGGGWDWAARQARESPLNFIPEKKEDFNYVASLAYYLSVLNAQFPFPVEKVGAFLGMSEQMGSITIRMLEREGVIALARKYSRHQRMANEFVFVWPHAFAPNPESARVERAHL